MHHITENIDLTIVVIYMALTLIIGFISGRKIKNFEEFAVSKREYSTIVLVATIFATLIGGNSTVGAIAEVYSIGVVVIFAFFGQSLKSMIAAKLIAPRLKTHFPNAVSIGDLYGSLYGKTGRVFAGLAASISSLVDASAQVFAIGFLLNFFFEVDLNMAMILGYSIIIFYSAFGGINSVVKTDIFQFFILIVAIPLVSSECLKIVGGNERLFQIVDPQKLALGSEHILKHGLLFFLFGFFYITPTFLQRILIAPDAKTIVKSFKITAVLSAVFFIIIAQIGLMATTINDSLEPNQVLFYLINHIMPVGLKGIIICGLIAAIMSSADSVLNTSSVSIYKDVIKVFWNRDFSDKKDLLFIRLITLTSGLATVLIAMNSTRILDIILFSIYFWSPIVLIPLYGIAMNKVISEKGFIICSLTGVISSIICNGFSLSETIGIHNLIPVMCSITIVFSFFVKKEGREAFTLKE